MRIRALLYFLVLVCVQMAQAQLLDTSDVHTFKRIEVSTISESGIHLLNLDSTHEDTTVNLFYNYYAPYKTDFPFLDQGLEGSALLPLAASHERELNFNIGMHNMDAYFFDHSINIYQTKRPFTRLNYSQGAREMINMEISHGQQISERLAFGLDYRRLKNQNFYYSNLPSASTLRMSNLFNSKFYTSYYSKDRKYELITSYLWNRSINAETGGVASDSIFNTQVDRDKLQNNAANYTSAKGSQAQNSFRVTQYFRPGGKSTDSTLDFTLQQFNAQFFLKSELTHNRFEFEDKAPDSTNYGKKTDAFLDSINHRSIQNELGYMIKIKPLRLSVSLSHAIDRVYQNGNIVNFNSVYLNGITQFKVKQFSIDANARFGLLGYNLGDYHIEGKATTLFKLFNLKGGIRSQLIEPSYTEIMRYSPVISWENSYKKIANNQLFGQAGIHLKQHQLGAEVLLETINNFIYYNQTNTINQANTLVSLLRTQFSYGLNQKYFGVNANMVLQNSSNQQVLPRPNTAASINLFSKFALFKKNLKMQAGLRTFWFSQFDAPMYNPYTKQWHNSSTAFTMYSPVNVYANAKVKNFYLGVEFFHTQQGLLGDAYYSSPTYPMMPRSMRLNIRWDLNN